MKDFIDNDFSSTNVPNGNLGVAKYDVQIGTDLITKLVVFTLKRELKGSPKIAFHKLFIVAQILLSKFIYYYVFDLLIMDLNPRDAEKYCHIENIKT